MPSLAELLAGQRMVQQQPSAFDYAGQMMQFQQGMDQFNANRALREMFAQGIPSAQDIYAVSPEFGMQWSKSQMEQAEKMLGMQEKRGQIQKLTQEGALSKEKAFADATGPAADQYFDDINAGMPPEQALAKFRQGFAAGISRLDAMGMSPDAQIDVNNLNPEQVLGVATGKGYKSRYYEQQQEERKMEKQHQYRVGEMGYGEGLERGTEKFKRGLPPAPTPQQYYGGVEMTPQGPMAVPPVVQGGELPQASPEGMQQAPITNEDVDNIRRMYQQATGADKKRLERMLADAVKQQVSARPSAATPEQAPFHRIAPAGIITPEQRQRISVEEAKAKETAQAEAKAAVEQQEVKRQKAEILSSVPKVPEINKLIDKSMSGRIEELGKGTLLGEYGGISTEALNATKELNIIGSQMKQITKSLIGAGAVSDFEQRQMAEAAGNIADPRTPAEARKRQLAMFNRIVRKSLMKSPELAGKLSEEDDSTEAEQEEAPSVKRGSKPKIGQVESGYMFKGGDPSNPANWEKQ